MKCFFSLLVFSIIILSLGSCYYDKEELLYRTNNGVCADTTTTSSYAQQVVPVFQQFCYSCHTGSFPSGGVLMGTYAADKTIGQNGTLYGSISHAGGYSPMPKGMSKMTACQIAAVKRWIDKGMPNN